MMLLTQAILKKLPKIGSQETIEDPIAQVKFFYPCGSWTCYVIEFDGQDELFCKTVTDACPEGELGYASLKEISAAKGLMGLGIERDKWFKPTPISQCK
jgi:hypothetical protein